MRLFDVVGLEWPPTSRGFDGSLDHMDQRPYEVSVYCNTKWPFQLPADDADGAVESGIQFLDVNQDLIRLVGVEGLSCPWKAVMPTLTGSGQYIFRRAVPEREDNGSFKYYLEIRQLDGMELLQMIGFSLEYIEGSFPSHEVATSMAGNAYSGFAVGPMAILAILGLSSRLQKDAAARECLDDMDCESEDL
jgi:hypothetical protein